MLVASFRPHSLATTNRPEIRPPGPAHSTSDSHRQTRSPPPDTLERPLLHQPFRRPPVSRLNVPNQHRRRGSRCDNIKSYTSRVDHAAPGAWAGRPIIDDNGRREYTRVPSLKHRYLAQYSPTRPYPVLLHFAGLPYYHDSPVGHYDYETSPSPVVYDQIPQTIYPTSLYRILLCHLPSHLRRFYSAPFPCRLVIPPSCPPDNDPLA